MAPPTVGELFAAWDGCHKEARVWEYLRDSLDKTMRLSREGDDVVLIRTKDGRAVEEEVMIRVLAEIDGMVVELEEQAKGIEAQTVG